MVNREKLTKLSKQLRQLKLQARADLVKGARKFKLARKVVFPEFLFKPAHTYVRAAPWMFNGFFVHFDNLILVVDPGVDLLTRCIFSGINFVEANAMFLSHVHYDHCASADVVLEAMSFGNQGKQIVVMAPANVYQQGKISKHNDTVKSLLIKSNKDIKIDKYQLIPIELFHSIDQTYGFVLNLGPVKLGYISDTGYTKKFLSTDGKIYKTGIDNYRGEFVEIVEKHDYIKQAFRNVDVLICNLNDFIYTKHSKYHLTGFDLIDILKNSQIKTCVINHLNQLDLTNNKFLKGLENYLQQVTGVRIRACFPHGLEIDLS